MAIAAQTEAVQQELLRQLNIVAKAMYQLKTQPQSMASSGPAFDTLMAPALAAIKAAGYTLPA